jgi:polyhydroxyalkanoate synthesis regulator phasin
MKALQEQAENIINKLWERTPLFPEEGRKAISEWIKTYKKGRDDYKNMVDESFKKVEDFFNEKK